MVLVFAGGIVIWGVALCALLVLTFLPLLLGMGANAGYLYYFGIGLVVACIFGTHIYHKMIGDEKEKISCAITAILAGFGAGSLWPFLPFIWFYKVYKKWEDERSRRGVRAYLEKEQRTQK